MNVEVQSVNDDLVWLVLTGDLDLATVERLTDGVKQAIILHRPRWLVVDLAALRFCDSTGVTALIEAHETAARRGVTLRVVNVDDLTRRIMKVTGALEVLGA